MDWIGWIVPLIVLGMWIFSNLAKQQENERRPPRPMPPPRDPQSSDMPRPKRSPDELERMREEFRRRQRDKQRAAERIPPPPRRSEQGPRAPSVPPPLPMEVPPFVPAAVPVALVAAPEPAPLPVPPPAPVVSADRPMSGSIKIVLELLKKRESLRSAVVLREILDGPVSKRRRRSGT